MSDLWSRFVVAVCRNRRTCYEGWINRRLDGKDDLLDLGFFFTQRGARRWGDRRQKNHRGTTTLVIMELSTTEYTKRIVQAPPGWPLGSPE